MTWQLSLAGLLVGVLVGMTGMGGGSLMTPILILLFNFDPRVAVGTDILHGAIFKTFGAGRHRMLGTVHARLAFWMLVGSGPASLVGVQVASAIGNVETFQKVVGVALIIGGVGFLVKTFIHGHPSNAPFLLQRRDKVIAITIGAFGGFIVGLTSVGSGTFFALSMLFVFPLTAAKIVGTDVAHASALLWIAGTASLIHGNVDLPAMAWLLVGSIPGVLIGSHVSIHVPERMLRVSFGIVLILAGSRILDVPGSSYAIVAVLGAGAIALAVWGVRRLLVRRVAAQDSA